MLGSFLHAVQMKLTEKYLFIGLRTSVLLVGRFGIGPVIPTAIGKMSLHSPDYLKVYRLCADSGRGCESELSFAGTG
jgi:hypothetical protein